MPTTEPYVLIAEDEPPVVELLRYNLEKAKFEVGVAYDGEDAWYKLENRVPDLLVLDWMLPKLSGMEICRKLRKSKHFKNLPIIMLTARSEESDRILGLDSGADDYVTKPFSPVELVSRIRAVLRRIRPALFEDVYTVGDITIDRSKRTVHRSGDILHLGPKEFLILDLLCQHPGRVFSRGQLLDQIWGTEKDVMVRTVDVHVVRLRKVLCEKGAKDPIRTVRSAGYALKTK